MKDFGLYIVMTSPLLGYQLFTEICVEQEVPIIQLRDKTLKDADLLRLATTLASITRGSKTTFILNDRVDLCILSGADGVHLGPDDISWQEARKLLLPNHLIGVSTHSMEEAERVLTDSTDSALSPDYMSFGPIYATVAKAIPDPPVGIEQLRRVLGKAHLPVVAIGGIFPDQLADVLSTGARNISMIRHFGEASTKTELTTKIKQLNQLLSEV